MLRLRPVEDGDVDFLWRMLFRAWWSHLDEGATEQSIRARPDLAHYVEGWGRPGDDGVVALDATGALVGAAWLRLLTGEHRLGPAFVADDVPELAIAVEEGHEGQGVGSSLLEGLLARSGDRTIVLTARATNPAVRLYERFGFEVVETITNRIGTASVKMVRPAGATGPGPAVVAATR
jgi:ribosomal protein S18 acetylase RimI-like enzyme